MSNKFSDKKIAVLGLSTEGIALVKYFSAKKYDLIALDKKNLSEMVPENANIIKSLKIKYQLGADYLKNLDKFDIIFRSPGIPLWLPQLISAQKKGIEISSLTKFFFDLCPCPIIGVTGTKGKGTTCSLIYEILKLDQQDVYLGGNIGNPLLNIIDKLTASSVVVLELSSFQLEDLTISPHISVILNITSDHLASSSLESPNYHLNLDSYYKAKQNIVKYQTNHDYAVVNYDYPVSKSYQNLTPAKILSFSRKKMVPAGSFVRNHKIFLKQKDKEIEICSVKDILLRGEHNLENITAAVCASYLSGVKMDSLKKGITTFKGLEHRLELVAQINGVKYYNDSFATTPQTTIAAIKSFTEPIILIAGGSEKGADYTTLGQKIVQNKIKTVILIGQMAPRIEEAIQKAGNFTTEVITGLKDMPSIVSCTAKIAKKGNVVLLSPACASFDMFKNYKDRGNQFKTQVLNLNEKENQ